MTLTSGMRLGPFEIVSPLGQGGMGEVYRARDSRLERDVAIKALPAAFAGDPERLARFEREARLLASLSHPNVAVIHGLETANGLPHLVLELVEGETLAQRIARGPLSVGETLEIGAPIASALDAAHARGVVHRDLKPGNVMITPSRIVKVLDFGLAKLAGGTTASSSSVLPTAAMDATAAGMILGTAPYMSPEQARGREVDRRTDLWALGCVLFECLTGRAVFEGETVSDVIARILERDPDWSRLPATTPERLRALIQRCLAKDAAARPRDADELRRELDAITLQRSSGAAATPQAERPSLAVLYFENLSSDPSSEYFCAGITEDILTDLSKIKGLRVASRNAVARFRGAPADLAKVGAELGVKAVLEGSVRRAGDRVRISAQLVSAADGFQLWAERYDRTLEDVFAVQEEIASSIAEALRVALSPAEAEKLVSDRPRDVRAYDLYLKGRARYEKFTRESLDEARALFQQAIAIDPDYALAWAGVADCCGQMCQWGFGDPAAEAKVGLEAARRAIAINPRLAEGHKAEGLVRKFSGDREGARAALRRALEANPAYGPALINLAVEAVGNGAVAAGERLVRRAIDADPENAFATTWLAFLYTLTNRNEEVGAVARRLRQITHESFYLTGSYALEGIAALGLGNAAAAEEAIRTGTAVGAEAVNLRTIEAMLAARAGRTDDARRMVGQFEASMSLATGALLVAAAVAVRIGDLEAGARFMSRRIASDLAPVMIRLDPGLHPLLDHPRFAPRRMDATLVWPLESPMIDGVRFELFKDVRIESGRPRGSDVLANL